MRKPAKGYSRSKANPKNRCVIDHDTEMDSVPCVPHWVAPSRLQISVGGTAISSSHTAWCVLQAQLVVST